MLVTQPGRLSSGEGAVAVRGVMSARESSPVKSVDIAPTILHLLGVPISRELAGAPVSAAFDGSFLIRFPVRYVASYGARERRELRRGDPLDAEALERLRSLGYVR
jgi:arylsulfatase A-like enzyme